MLSAAHVLAMDAKNLLDVVDSIRLRFPNIMQNNSHQSGTTTPINPQIEAGGVSPPNIQHTIHTVVDTLSPKSNMMEQSENSELLYSNQQEMGIYDNEYAINQQQQQQNQHNKQHSGESAGFKLSLAKPMIAVKPINLGQKLKTNNYMNAQQQHISQEQNDKILLEQSLQIIEDPIEMYSNIGHCQSLPEPVPCTIVQENIINSQKITSNKID